MKKILDRFPDLSVAVIGDVMLDIFTYGVSERLSPEAPVPVIRIFKRDYCAGGAGNVAENLASLDVKSSLFGVTGKDYNAEKLAESIRDTAIESFLLADGSRPTTVKERFVANHQQLLRVDAEETVAVDEKIKNEFFDRIADLMKSGKLDAIIFSDYKKGVLSTDLVQRLIDCANTCNVITALDPKPGSLDVVHDLTILKPNRSEAFALAGMKDDLLADAENKRSLLLEAAKHIYEKYSPKYLVISLSADGIAVYENGSLNIIPTAAKEVFDVSGAGDTLIASMTCALASCGRIMDAAQIGNIASGIAVGKRGTSCVSRDEIIGGIR